MDPILYWNEVALEANRVSHTKEPHEQPGPPLSSRALAIVHLAMYDAYVGVDAAAGYLPYMPNPPQAPAGASVEAAVAAAAHATLSGLFPLQKDFFDRRHAAAGLRGPGLQVGHQYGIRVADAILQDRKDDPGASDDGYAASQARGAHRQDPDNPTQGFHGPYYGSRSKCFAVTQRHGLARPPQPDPADASYGAYLDALRQVYAKGIAPRLQGTLPMAVAGRTPEESLIGVYWGYDGTKELGTPPRLYNQFVRQVAAAQGTSPAENARLFALINAAMGDAGILAWEQKYVHDLWRPILGIREHAPSMGPTAAGGDNFADCDPHWLPFGGPASNSHDKNFTPPFPAYPSGHATFGAAALQAARRFFQVTANGPDNLGKDPQGAFLDFVSDELNGTNRDNEGTVRPRHARRFDGGLWDMIVENGLSRIFLGVHWVFDAFAATKSGQPDLSQNVGGVPLGLAIANDIFDGGLQKSNVGPSA
jgi:vanadium chloroperoxidase